MITCHIKYHCLIEMVIEISIIGGYLFDRFVTKNCDRFMTKKKSVNKLWWEGGVKILVMDLRLLCARFL